jgi:uncharacterized membrane protein YdjX (TVP38/TMEM64 family)
MKENKGSTILIIIGFLFSVGCIYYVAHNMEVISKFITSVGVFGPILSVVLYGVLSITPIPTDPISVLNGALFGPVVGSLVSWMGNNIAAFIEYYLGMGIRNLTHFDKVKNKLPFGLGKLPVSSFGFLFFGRFVPQVGGKVVSLMGGMYKVPIKKYMWTAALSNIVGAILFALGGWSLLKVF